MSTSRTAPMDTSDIDTKRRRQRDEDADDVCHDEQMANGKRQKTLGSSLMNESTMSSVSSPSSAKSASSVSSPESKHGQGRHIAEDDDVAMNGGLLQPSTSSAATCGGWTTVNGTIAPPDWPPQYGPVDLTVHDLPHGTSETEWWYVNSHVKTASGKELSVFASFFIVRTEAYVDPAGDKCAHAITWAIVDPADGRYHCMGSVSKNTPAFMRHQLKAGTFKLDHRLRRALEEQLDRESGPDRFFEEPTRIAEDRLDISMDGCTFVKTSSNTYVIKCQSKHLQGGGFELEFQPRKAVVRHGHDGVVKISRQGEDMFYYFVPRCSVSGTVTLPNQQPQAVKGQGWYDHEFGGMASTTSEQKNDSMTGNSSTEPAEYGWNWLSAQLSDGTDISSTEVFQFVDDEPKSTDQFALVVDAAGRRTEHLDSVLTASEDDTWMSVRTAAKHPTKYRLVIPSTNTDLRIEAALPHQEFVIAIAKPAFWEGRVHIRGTHNGVPVTGVGFVERHGFCRMENLEAFFRNISKIVLNQISKLLPLNPTREQATHLIADVKHQRYLDGYNIQVYNDTVIRLIREITDRGGKSWRSFAMMVCVDAVGGNSLDYLTSVAVPEVLHVGSLIVDDIQDESETRRGGPACHRLYGEPLSINAGTTAYFVLVQRVMELTPNLTDQDRLKLYDGYFLMLRAAHAGQALDIYGLGYMMPEVVESGNIVELEKAIICTHRLKSAVPAGTVARHGARLGRGTEAQMEALGEYFEALGIAFQIIDDVLNLRGFHNNGKQQGEDINAGKVTYPVVLAMSSERLNHADRKWLWDTISSKPQERAVVGQVIDKIEACGALDASVQRATTLCNDAFAKLDANLPDSFYKMLLRAFGWFVLERHY